MEDSALELLWLSILNSENFLGDYSEGGTPVPIPNTVVKPFSGDGTAHKRVGEEHVAKIIIKRPA